MDKRSCVLCRNPVDLGNSISHSVCLHRTHTSCIDESNVDFKKCAHCLGQVNLNEPLLPDVEPGSLSGIDYVENPLKRSYLKKVTSIASVLKLQTKEVATDPRYLLSFGPKECPLDWLMREKGLGLQRFLEEGITLGDFLSYGYTPADLNLFKDMTERPGKALIALQIEPDHIYKYRDLATHLTGKEMVLHAGMKFGPKGGPLPGSNGWTAADLLEIGWKAADLFGAEMEYVEQYAALQPTDEEERALGMTQEDINSLRDLNQPPRQQQQPTVRVQVQVVEPPTRHLHHGLKRK